MWPSIPHPTEGETRALWLRETRGLVPPHEQVRFYPSVAVALSDLCRGLMGMYSNKKNILRLKGLYRGYSNLVKGLSQEGALIQDIEFPKSLDLTEITTQLKKETLCVLMASDSPWTGEVFQIGPIWKSLIEKKIFAINVSGGPPSDTLPWESVGTHGIWIYEFQDGSCIAMLGSRYRAASGIFGVTRPPVLDFSWLKSADIPEAQTQAVLAFEKKYRSSAAPPLRSERRFDRALLHFPDLDGSALRDLLIRKGEDVWASGLETFSLCRWEDLDQFEDLLERGWSKEDLRGTLLVSASLLRPSFDSTLDNALAELRLLQTGG
jgi:hypothetical protein